MFWHCLSFDIILMLSSETKALKLQDGQRSRALSFAWREVQEAVTDAKEGRGEVPAATRFGRQRWQHGEVVGVFVDVFWFFFVLQPPNRRNHNLVSLQNGQQIWMSFDGTHLYMKSFLISVHYLPSWPPLLSYHPRAKELLHAILAAYCSAGAAAHAEEILFMSSEELGVEAPWRVPTLHIRGLSRRWWFFNGMFWDQYLFQLKVNLFFCLILTFTRWWIVLLDCRNPPDFILFDRVSCYLQ